MLPERPAAEHSSAHVLMELSPAARVWKARMSANISVQHGILDQQSGMSTYEHRGFATSHNKVKQSVWILQYFQYAINTHRSAAPQLVSDPAPPPQLVLSLSRPWFIRLCLWCSEGITGRHLPLFQHGNQALETGKETRRRWVSSLEYA